MVAAGLACFKQWLRRKTYRWLADERLRNEKRLRSPVFRQTKLGAGYQAASTSTGAASQSLTERSSLAEASVQPAIDVFLQVRPFASAIALGKLLGELVEPGVLVRTRWS
jgi:hypothetical protein